MSSEALTSDIPTAAPLQQDSGSPFGDLDRYIALPRLGSLALSPDGSRLVTCVSVLNSAATEYTSALWELDPAGERPARRITRSSKGESGAAFARNGDLYFTSARPGANACEPSIRIRIRSPSWTVSAPGIFTTGRGPPNDADRAETPRRPPATAVDSAWLRKSANCC